MLELPEVMDVIECNRCGYKVSNQLYPISVPSLIINLNSLSQLSKWNRNPGYLINHKSLNSLINHIELLFNKPVLNVAMKKHIFQLLNWDQQMKDRLYSMNV